MIRAVGVMMTCLLFVQSNSFGAESAQDLLEKVKQKYDSLRDAELKFTQRTSVSSSKAGRSSSGILWIKKGNKYRLEMGGTTIVTDGSTVWSYTPANNRVLIDKFKVDDRTITPEKIIAAAPSDYDASFAGNDMIGKTSTQILKLVPHEGNSSVQEMKLWIDPSTWLMKKVEVTDFSGKKTTYLVASIRTDTDIPDSRFVFQIPAGVETVDLR